MAGVFALLFLLYLLFIGGVITASVFYVKNLMDLMKQVDPKNRLVHPGFVWMLFIPFYGAVIYPFMLYPRIAESLKKEFDDRNSPQPGDYGKSLGIVLPILICCMIIPVLNILALIGFLVIGIIFWVKMAQYKTMLKRLPKSDGVRISSNTDLLD
ncbi:hypothetical protein [Fluviicola sp.]|uniref:hypothetical protein n=1 Tax=Fluviicola sp. TaxID=1917219 RepID=UPI003D26B7FA